jgi:cytochrome c556
MLRKWAILAAVAASVVLVIAGAAVQVSRAGDDEDKPLKKLMKKIDADTKSIREATTTLTKFKKSGNGKDLAKIASEIARLGKETREFGKEPSEKMKKPFDKWLDMNDRFVAAAGELAQFADKGDFVATRKAWSALNNTCTNCHGAFRPEVGDGF